MLPFRERFPLEAELARIVPDGKLVVPSSVVDELLRLQTDGVRDVAGAIEYARRFPSIVAEGRGDESILKLAVRLGAGVVTGDRAFQARLSLAGVPVLGPRGRSRLELRLASGNS
jgi:rRNA-processing protein FCF1